MPIGARSRSRSAKLKKEIVSKAKKASRDHVPAELTDYAKSRMPKVTSEDVPGNGMAKKAARAIEKRRRQQREMLDNL